MRRVLLILFIGFITNQCVFDTNEMDSTSPSKEDQEIADMEDDSSQSTNEDSLNLPRASWRNPVMFPMGASVGNYLRAYYIVGMFDKMAEFLVFPNCMSSEEILYHIRQMEWGYDIKLTNIQWTTDSSFIATYKTTQNLTTGIEQYYGEIVNDSAKLLVDITKTNLFVNLYEHPNLDYCTLKENLENLEFEFDSDVLLPESQVYLDQIQEFFYANPGFKISIEGHTSSEGQEDYNITLSEQRAKAIYDELKKNPKVNVQSYVGKGSSFPIYTNNNEENRSKNRRVEIKFLL